MVDVGNSTQPQDQSFVNGEEGWDGVVVPVIIEVDLKFWY